MRVLQHAVVAGVVVMIWGCGGESPGESRAGLVPATTADPEEGGSDRPERKSAGNDIPARQDHASKTEEPDLAVRLTPEEFKAEFEDHDSPRRKAGVVLEVRGVVTGVHTSFGDQPFVTLKTRGDGPDGGTPYYTMAREPWATLSPGQSATLRGRWDGERGWIFEIAEAGPSTSPIMSAEALAKEYARDHEATNERYRDKAMIVTGTVLKIERDGAVTVMLAGAEGVPVICIISGFDKALAEPLGIGDNVAIHGEYFPGLSDAGPSLATSRPITSFKPPDASRPKSRWPDASASTTPKMPAEPNRPGASAKPPSADVAWLKVADVLEAKRQIAGLSTQCRSFEGPSGNGRRGARGVFVPLANSAGTTATAWRFTWEWGDTARGVHVVHPFRDGHLLVLIYRDYVAVFPGGDWPHEEYLGKSSAPMTRTNAHAAVFPLPAKQQIRIESRLEPNGRYSLTIDDREVVQAMIDAVEPLQLPETFRGDDLPRPWPAGSAGMIVGPVDTGVNRVTVIELLSRGSDRPAEELRHPVPDKEARETALAALREVLRDDYDAARDTESRRTLARKLHELALETKRDPDARFVMLEEARELAIRAMDVRRLASVLDALEEFAVDGPALTRESLERMARDVTSPDEGESIVEMALNESRQAEKQEEFESALAFATTASIAATRMRDTKRRDEVRNRRQEIETLRQRFLDAESARTVLADVPDDPTANHVLGSYLLFARGDWKQGLPRLAKSNDEEVRALAERELANIRTPDELAALGDAWFTLAESRTGREREDFRQRAAAWYRQAVERVTGLTRERIRQRLEDLRASPR